MTPFPIYPAWWDIQSPPSENDYLDGGAGFDTLDGGAGINTADYSDATAGLYVDLSFNWASDTRGDDFLDTLTGSNSNDTLIGGLGNDLLDGGSGIDTVSYASATAAVNVNLCLQIIAVCEYSTAIGGPTLH